MPAKRNRNLPKGVIEHPIGSGIYAAQYKDQHGGRHREQAGTPQEAADLYALRMAQVRQGTFHPDVLKRNAAPRNGQMPLKDAIERYMEESRATKLSSADDERYAKYWTAHFGSRIRLAEVTSEHVLAYRRKRLATNTGRKRPPRPGTINRAIAFLRRVFSVMRKAKLVAENPVSDVEDLPEENEMTDLLEDKQEDVLGELLLAEKVVQVAGYKRKGRRGARVAGYTATYKNGRALLHRMIQLAADTGLRQGEQLRIRREDVLWERSMLNIPRSKNRRSRVIKLSAASLDVLRSEFDSHNSAWLYPRRSDPSKHRTASGVEKAWGLALQEAGLPHIRWHALRATFVTRMLEEGATWEEVRQHIGHSTIDMVRRYARLVEERQRAVLERLSERRNRRRSGGASVGPGAIENAISGNGGD